MFNRREMLLSIFKFPSLSILFYVAHSHLLIFKNKIIIIIKISKKLKKKKKRAK